jgi:methionine-rich copper-binding protein CopC
MLRLLVTFALALLLGVLFSPHAEAHARLIKANPQVDSVVTVSPGTVALTFSEAVEPRFSKVEVVAADGHVVPMAKIEAEGDTLVAPIAADALSPGPYSVRWQVLSVDGHKIQGEFKFELRP